MSVLASQQERIGRNSLNSFKPPSSDGEGYKTRIPRQGSGRKRGGQPGHPACGRSCCRLSAARAPMTIIPPIQAEVIEHRLHRLLCPCCSTSTCAELPQGVETSHYGPRLISLVGLLGRLLGVSISAGAIVAIRARLAACLPEAMEDALREARLQPVVYIDETGGPTNNGA